MRGTTALAVPYLTKSARQALDLVAAEAVCQHLETINEMGRLLEDARGPDGLPAKEDRDYYVRLLTIRASQLSLIVHRALGDTKHVTMRRIGQDGLTPWKEQPPAVREAFEVFAKTALEHGVDLAALMGAKPVEALEGRDAHHPAA